MFILLTMASGGLICLNSHRITSVNESSHGRTSKVILSNGTEFYVNETVAVVYQKCLEACRGVI